MLLVIAAMFEKDFVMTGKHQRANSDSVLLQEKYLGYQKKLSQF